MFWVAGNRTQDMGHSRQMLHHRATFLACFFLCIYYYCACLWVMCVFMCVPLHVWWCQWTTLQNEFFLHLSVGFEAWIEAVRLVWQRPSCAESPHQPTLVFSNLHLRMSSPAQWVLNDSSVEVNSSPQYYQGLNTDCKETCSGVGEAAQGLRVFAVQPEVSNLDPSTHTITSHMPGTTALRRRRQKAGRGLLASSLAENI